MELLQLDAYNRTASLGNEYHYLKKIYPNWSRDLHGKGNIIENLLTIGMEGIVRWYFENKIKFSIDYNFSRINEFEYNIYSMTFYDYYHIMTLALYLDIKVKDFDPKITSKSTFLFGKFKTKGFPYKITKEHEKYFTSTFAHYIVDYIGKDYVVDIINQCYVYIETNKNFFNNGSLLNTFIDKYKVIEDYVVIFQKFKVILEKMTFMKHPDIFKIDRFVEKIQQVIFSYVNYYINNFFINDSSEIIINDTIFDIINDKKFLQPYKPEEFNFDFIHV
jgi:hypothetical protein